MKNKIELTQLEILNRIYDQDLKSANRGNSKELQTINFGKIEVWNYIDCQRQTAESEGNDFECQIRCSLSDESDEAIKFFTRHGFII